jgi:membrane protease YdiL (CAAX protease family)
LAHAVQNGLVSQSLQSIDNIAGVYNMIFGRPLKALSLASQGLEFLILQGSENVPQSRLNPAVFMFIDPYMGGGFHGFPGGFGGGGFHGNPMIYGHPGGFVHPMVHHHPAGYQHGHPMIHDYPGGFFYDLFEPPIRTTNRGEAQSEEQQVIEFIVVLVCVLVIAPVSEEIVFRGVFYQIRRLWEWVRSVSNSMTNQKSQQKGPTDEAVGAVKRAAAQSGRSSSSTSVSCWHQPWLLVSCIFFAAAHLSNHVPRAGRIETLLQEQGVEYAMNQLTLASTQFLVTLFLSVRVFWPVYQSMGLASAMGAHFMWNACALTLAYQGWIRLVLLGYSFVLGRRRLTETNDRAPVSVDELRRTRLEFFYRRCGDTKDTSHKVKVD